MSFASSLLLLQSIDTRWAFSLNKCRGTQKDKGNSVRVRGGTSRHLSGGGRVRAGHYTRILCAKSAKASRTIIHSDCSVKSPRYGDIDTLPRAYSLPTPPESPFVLVIFLVQFAFEPLFSCILWNLQFLFFIASLLADPLSARFPFIFLFAW